MIVDNKKAKQKSYEFAASLVDTIWNEADEITWKVTSENESNNLWLNDREEIVNMIETNLLKFISPKTISK